jgi:hypothetical protein
LHTWPDFKLIKLDHPSLLSQILLHCVNSAQIGVLIADDFEEPSPAPERNMDQVKDLKTISTTSQQELEVNARPQGAQDPRVPTPLTMNQGNLASAAQAAVPQRPQIDTTLSELPRRKGATAVLFCNFTPNIGNHQSLNYLLFAFCIHY